MVFFDMLKGRLRSVAVYSAFVGLIGLLFSVFLTIPTASAQNTPVDEEAWEKLAQCESNGDWSIDSGNGFSGGLQFMDSTWAVYGGTEFAPTAAQATKEEQMYVANQVLEKQGWQAWPSCSASTGVANEYVFNPDFPKPSSGGGDEDENDDSDTSATVPGVDEGNEASEEDANSSDSDNDSDNASGSRGEDEGDDSGNDGDDALSGSDEESEEGSDGDSGSSGGDGSSGGTRDETPITDPYGRAKLRAEASEQLLRPEFGSPAQYAVNAKNINDLGEASKYLGFQRFRVLNLPSTNDGSLISNTINSVFRGFAGLIFAGVSALAHIIGLLLIFVLNTDLVGRGVYFADLVFARLAINLTFSPDDTGVSLVSKVMFFVFLIIMGFWVWTVLRPGRASIKEMLAPMLGAVVSIFAVALFGTQASKNHPSLASGDRLSEIGRNANDEEAAHLLENADTANKVVELTKDPKNWTVLSPGWAIAWINHAAKYVGAIAGDLTGSLFSAINSTINPESDSYTECDLYMQGMYAVFLNTPAAKSNINETTKGWLPDTGPGQILVSYDRMYMSSIHSLWQEASFGSSDGAGGAWCRFAEASSGSAPAEQAMISRVAGLYPEVVGTGGLGMVSTKREGTTTGAVVYHKAYDPSKNGRSFQPSDGTLVLANGNWNTEGKIGDLGQTPKEAGSSGEASSENNERIKGQYVPVDAARNFFGPTYRNLAGEAQAKFYFAGCDYTQQGQPARIRAEWRGVTRAMINEPLIDEDCSGTITNGENDAGGFGQRMYSKSAEDVHAVTASAWNYSSHRDDNDAERELFDTAVENSDSTVKGWMKWVGNKIGSWTNADDAAFAVKSPLTDSSSEIIKKFRGAERTGAEVMGEAPLDREGDRPSKAGNAPLEFYNFISSNNHISTLYGFIAIVVLYYITKSFLPLLLGALISQAVVIVFLMVSAIMIIFAFIPKVMNSLKTAMTTVISALLVVSIIQLMMDLVFNLGGFFSTLFNIGSLEAGFVKSIAVGLSYIVAFKLVILVASKITAIDMSTMHGAATAGVAAGAPALQGLDAKITSPLSRDFWRLNRGNKSNLRELGRRSKNLGSDARNAIEQDAKKRRVIEQDAAQRNRGNRVLPETKKDGKPKGSRFGSAFKGAVTSGVAAAALNAAKTNPAVRTGFIAAKGAGKVLAFGKKGVDVTRKGARAIEATKNAAANILNPNGNNGANDDRPLDELNNKGGVVPQIANYRGTTRSSGGSLVASSVRNMLDGHPLRALKSGKLTDLANAAIGFVPDSMDSMNDNVYAPLNASNIDAVAQATPGVQSAPIEEVVNGGEVDSSRLDETRQARQKAFMDKHNTVLDNARRMSDEDFQAYMDAASAVGGIAGADRQTFVTENGLPTQQFSTALNNMNSKKRLNRLREAGIIDEEMHKLFREAIKNDVDLNNLDYVGKTDDLSLAVQRFHSQQNLATFEELGVLSSQARSILQNAIDNGRDIVNVDIHDEANRDIVQALADVAAKSQQSYVENTTSYRDAFKKQFAEGGHREDYVKEVRNVHNNKKQEFQRELELKSTAARQEYDKNMAEMKKQFIEAKSRILEMGDVAQRFGRMFRSGKNTESSKDDG